VRPAKLWNDTESAPQAARLVEAIGAQAWAEATGSVPVASFTITKLAWLAEHEPTTLDASASVLLPHDWLTLALTGRAVTDRGDASGTGYLDPVTGTYRHDLLDLAAPERTHDWSQLLPEVLGPSDQAGTVRPAAGDPLGLRSCVVAAGTGDNMAAALGLALAPGDITVSLGTSGTVYAVSETPTHDPSGSVAGFADATGRYLPLACTLNATQVTDTMGRWLGLDTDELATAALGARPGAGGTILVPYLSGERTPNRPNATGRLEGLRLDTTASDLARAAHEGVVCSLLDALDALEAAGVPTARGRLVAVGGGSRSVAYQRILADLSGRPITLADGTEHVATGACVQAAACLAGSGPVDVARAWGLGAGTEVDPDPEVDADAIRQRYAVARDRDDHAD
jgi:xylulokinase